LRGIGLLAAAGALMLCGACSTAGLRNAAGPAPGSATVAASDAGGSHANIDILVSHYAAINDIPPTLVHKVIDRESDYNTAARNGPYWGLMQISHATAKSMGYDGPASGLLDPDVNLKYAVRYLAGAYVVGGGSDQQAIRNYSRGYYYDAKRQGLLEEVGLR
jgi:soluble lytic murein transglycosylase-like protein